MKTQIVTTGIVLSRTDFQEADRIITILTKDQGKVRLIAKGVRRVKSKLAGGIELFSVSEFTYIPGRGGIGTLISSRLKIHYGKIVTDLDRTMLGYELLKRIDRATEEAVGEEYFSLLKTSLHALDAQVALPHIELWFYAQLLSISGHTPNVQTDAEGNRLTDDDRYVFDLNTDSFSRRNDGQYEPSHIKLISLSLKLLKPELLANIKHVDKLLPECLGLVSRLVKASIKT